MSATERLLGVEEAEKCGTTYVDERGNIWKHRCPHSSNEYQVGTHVSVSSRKKHTTGTIVAALTQVKIGCCGYDKYRNSYCVVQRDDNAKCIMVQEGQLI